MKNNALISKNMSTFLKGVFCLFVLFHHLVKPGNAEVDAIFALLGPLAVGGFYFLSGYGVMVSYRSKGKKYIKKLICKRIPMMYLILVLTNLLYLGVYYLMGNAPLSFNETLVSVFYISFAKGFIPLYSWIYFLVNLIVFYFVTAIILLVVEKAKTDFDKGQLSAMVFVVVEVALIMILSFTSGKLLDFRAGLCFPLGIVCGSFYKNFYKIVTKNRLFFAVLISFLLCVVLTFSNTKDTIEYVAPVLFCLFIISIFGFCDFIKSKNVLWFGNISLYIYLFHGAFFKIFNQYLNINQWVQFALVVICSIAMSFLVFYAVKFSKECCIKIKKKKRVAL